MIQAAGPKFIQLLHEVFRTLWVHEIQLAAWQMSLMQPIYKGGDKSQADTAPYRGIYLSSTLSKVVWESLFLGWLNSQKLTIRWQKPNLKHVLADRFKMQYIACSLSSNTTYHRRVLQHTLPFVTSAPRSQASTVENSSHCYVKKILWEECGSISGKDFTWSRSASFTHGSQK